MLVLIGQGIVAGRVDESPDLFFRLGQGLLGHLLELKKALTTCAVGFVLENGDMRASLLSAKAGPIYPAKAKAGPIYPAKAQTGPIYPAKAKAGPIYPAKAKASFMFLRQCIYLPGL